MEIMQEIDKDKPFYEMSGGGVTFSGGEPFLQKDFLKLLLGKCKQKGYHTAVDTAGNVPWACIEMLLDDIDLFLYDIKLINEQKHKWATGQDNRTILDNFKRLAGSNANIIVRVPVVPTVNATERELSEIAVFIKDIDRRIPVEPLPFHRMGKSKYNSIGLVYKAENIKEIAIDEFEKLKQVFISNGLNVK
jgi:pyruvate formate lyase activating enzyme